MALEVATLTACGVPDHLARRHLPHMTAAMRKYGITTRPRARAFLATVLHESMALRASTEQASGAQYEGRRDLGNTHRGDGQRFKGRGPIQLTGRANYTFYGRKLGIDLAAHPDMVANPEVGWQVAGLFFQKCLPAADAQDFRRVTRLVNGGMNGWDDRLRYWNRLAKLGVVPGTPDIKRGAKGPKVELLTRRLSYLLSKKTGKPFLDGPRSNFDRKTTKALRRFQKERGLKVDGVFGPRVASELDMLVRAQKARRRKKSAAAAATPAAAQPAPAAVAHPAAPASTPAAQPATPTPAAPGAKKPRPRSKDDRIERLWRRLERLDELNDRVRKELAGLGPADAAAGAVVPGASAPAAPAEAAAAAGPAADPMSTTEVIAALKHVEADTVRVLGELEAFLMNVATQVQPASAAVGTATPAAGEGGGAPPPPAPPNAHGTAPHVQALGRLNAEEDRLRAILEQRFLDMEQAATASDGLVDNAEMQRFMALIGQLDAIDIKMDQVRRAIRRATGTAPKDGVKGAGADKDDRPESKRTGARTFRLGSKPMKGDDVRAWQVHMNRLLKKLKVDTEVAVDGEYGGETARWSKRVLYAVGVASGDWKGVTPEMRVKARHLDRRTPEEVVRAGKRGQWLARLRKSQAAPKGGARAAVRYAKKHADMKTREVRTNGGPHIDDWCRAVGLTPGTAGAHWCGAFANACLRQGGLKGWIWVRYTPSIVNNAKAGVDGWSWHAKPKVGDLALFDWPRQGEFVDHVGVVVATRADGSVTTVEGNMQNRVDYWQRKSMILGYARPPWKRG